MGLFSDKLPDRSQEVPDFSDLVPIRIHIERGSSKKEVESGLKALFPGITKAEVQAVANAWEKVKRYTCSIEFDSDGTVIDTKTGTNLKIIPTSNCFLTALYSENMLAELSDRHGMLSAGKVQISLKNSGESLGSCCNAYTSGCCGGPQGFPMRREEQDEIESYYLVETCDRLLQDWGLM